MQDTKVPFHSLNSRKATGLELITDKLQCVFDYCFRSLFSKHGIAESKNMKILKSFDICSSKLT